MKDCCQQRGRHGQEKQGTSRGSRRPAERSSNGLYFVLFFVNFDSYIMLQAIGRYLKGCLKKASASEVEGPKPKKIKQVYTIRDVIKQHYKSLVEDEIPFESTDKKYLGSFQKAVTTVLNKMSEEELEDAENILKTWNKEGGPSDLQLK